MQQDLGPTQGFATSAPAATEDEIGILAGLGQRTEGLRMQTQEPIHLLPSPGFSYGAVQQQDAGRDGHSSMGSRRIRSALPIVDEESDGEIP